MITQSHELHFEFQNFLVLANFLTLDELVYYEDICQSLLNHTEVSHPLRSDLSEGNQNSESEGITQIMLPSRIYPKLVQGVLHQRALKIDQELLGHDMNFDMVVITPPYSENPTPWHQDEAYWVEMPDKRSMTIWVSINGSRIDNGCFWYVSGSHKENLQEHY